MPRTRFGLRVLLPLVTVLIATSVLPALVAVASSFAV